ncbi:MAG TPA: HAMP domain-containing sensor histidine kinase [Flavobacteriales bacterium]|nr:HAMP domain-containing sensor histidine kinase [Flavobacteriales bacterium]
MSRHQHRHRATLLLFGATALYIVLQFIWWAYLLVRKDREMEALITAFELRTEGHVRDTFWMVVGEGSVFLLLVLVAMYLTFRAVRRDLELARMQHNFLLAVTHELRTPIASLKLQLQTLERAGLSARQRDELREDALEDVDRLGRLTETLLSAARLESGRHDLRPGPLDLVELVRAEMDRAARHGARLELKAPERLPARVDPEAMRMVVGNLLDNALKYGPADGPVDVSLDLSDNGATLVVADRGPGVPASERQVIFRRFHRGGDEETRRTKGTGLGLYLVGRTLEAMGGSVLVGDRPGGGAIFTATFPIS